MRHTFGMNAFMKWLPNNSQCFHNKPCNIRRNNNSVTFNLTGITKKLQWRVSESGAELWVLHQLPNHKGIFWDMLIDFDVNVARSTSCQYYCSICDCYLKTENKRQYYPTKLVLWEKHCFENILNWCNKQLTPDKLLILRGPTASGSTQANLFSLAAWKNIYKQQKTAPFKIIALQS